MKKIISLFLFSLFVTFAASAEWTKPATETRQVFEHKTYTAKVVDRRGTLGTDRTGYIEFTNPDKKWVTIDWVVYGDDKEVDRGQVKFTAKTHKEVFSYGDIKGVLDKKPTIKSYKVSIQVVEAVKSPVK